MYFKFNNQDDSSDNSYIRIISNNNQVNLYQSSYEDIEFSPDENGIMVLNFEIWTRNNLGRKGRIGFMKGLIDDRIIPVRFIDTPRDIEFKMVSNSGSNNSSNNSSVNNSPTKSITVSTSNELLNIDGESSLFNNNSSSNDYNNDQVIIILRNKTSLKISNNDLEHCIYGYFKINNGSRLSSKSRLISTDYQLQIYIKNNGDTFTIKSENTEVLVFPNIRDQVKDSITCSVSILDIRSKKQVYNTDVEFKIDNKSLKSFPKKYYIFNNNCSNNSTNNINNHNNHNNNILIISEIDNQKNLFEFNLDLNQ